MSINEDERRDVPMSIRMQQALTALRQMSIAEKIQLLVKAGLMTEAEAEQATDRVARQKKSRIRPKDRRTTRAPKAAKPRNS
jgi:hypothetical protein